MLLIQDLIYMFLLLLLIQWINLAVPVVMLVEQGEHLLFLLHFLAQM